MSYLDYEKMEEAALMQIVKMCLKIVSNEGLKGNHHFYITFLTAFPGVNIPEDLKAQYPEELTIVLQHQFENLEILQDSFKVDLEFDDVSTTIEVPYGSLINFYDPSVEFSIDFNPVIPASKTVTTLKPEATKSKPNGKSAGSKGKIISLDSFRNKSTT